ncbi:MAG: 30S ribosome-binding factor RbfA [Chloroflexi bacterium]|nr:30S ribosome-binding factor RbfA [Chloroflexota bacterium]MBU1662531.1 30S ribosome-binding factor RbfA [Chloroflexota bacterium]
MVSKMRAQRVAERIHEELSILLLMEVADPRLETVSITDVRVDRELAFANIYVSSIEGSDAAPEIINGLKHASGFLRRELARKIQLRSFPRLRFYWDPTPENADHIDQLIASLPEIEPPIPPDEEERSPNG